MTFQPLGRGDSMTWAQSLALQGLEALGIAVDPARNAERKGSEGEISPPGTKVRVFVVPTNEELLIARDTSRIVAGVPAE